MATTKKVAKQQSQVAVRPAITLEDKEKQMVSLAMDCAEQQLRDGTASSQIITHFLKLGTSLVDLEKEKLKNENLLLQAKADNIKSAASTEATYQAAIEAMMRYSGQAKYDEDQEV